MSRLFTCFIFLFLASLTYASPLVKDHTPEPLKPWVDWVLHDDASYQCPFFYNNFLQKRCSWPGELHLDLHATRAQFISKWQVFKENWINLPGNEKYWPQNVMVNGEPARVMSHQGRPRVRLDVGLYQITGYFFWDRIPDSLIIPQNTGLFRLKIKGKTIDFPIIHNDSVWLKASDRHQKKTKSIENRLELQVYRKVYDGVPLQLITFLELEVSGEQREIILPHALLEDFIPVDLKSLLPARIETNGSLLLQVRPGRWHIELNARYPHSVNKLKFNVSDPQWPASEIWSFHARPFHRLVEIQNLQSIDPSQTNVPRAWKDLPAYLLKQGESMAFKIIRRGDPEPEPNQLSLKRTLWLDFKGDGYTVTDSITGKMTKGWRLNALPEIQLGQVKLNGYNQLVTYSPETHKRGVEVRKGSINVVADSRMLGAIGNINAVGWAQNFNQVQAELNLPPGWRLLTVTGVDNDPDSWISQWTLLDLFLVLIASLAISRLWNIVWGIIALMTLSLCWHEPDAPQYIWLNILAAIALIRVLPDGKFQKIMKGYRNSGWAVLLILTIPFMVSQIRMGLYPQLEIPWQNISPLSAKKAESGRAMNIDNNAVKRRSIAFPKLRHLASPLMPETAQISAKTQGLNGIDPDANLQTGPGLPQWQWKKIHLSWNGSVDSQQRLNLWYLSPRINLCLNILRVILVVVLSLLMFGLLDKKIKFTLPRFNWVFLILILGSPVQDVSANFPEQPLLNELKRRLLQAPDCLPVCAQIPVMALSIDQQQLTIKLQVHVQQSVAIPLPSKQGQWFPQRVRVNGRQAQALIRQNNGLLWLHLEEGIHQLELQGRNPVQNEFSLPLPLKPHRTMISSQGWEIEGLHDDGRTDNQLIFNRLSTVQQKDQEKDKKQTLEPSVLPAFISIERTLKLGLDWRISTRVSRVLSHDAALVLKYPLLQGELVTSADIRVKDRHVQINLSARQNSVQWESVLKRSPQIELLAKDTDLWTEVWRVDISPVWHVETSGIAVVHHQDQGQWLPEWRPWPGEKIRLTITLPVAVIGPTLTIDKTELHLKSGKRSLESELKFTIRSSKGSQHTVQLPEQVELQAVMINGISQAIRQKGREVILPIKPGLQNISLNWRKIQVQSMLLTTPQVNMGISSVNNHITLILGRDRWVLFTAGPRFGPAVLFWGVLLVLILCAIGLGRLSLTPLTYWHWLLLLIGLSQIPLVLALVVVVWLIALGLRAKKQIVEPGYFNAAQIGLVLLTLVSLLLLFVAVQHGLLGVPDMQITGNQSTASRLNWYQDRSNDLLPVATVVSIPVMSYRVLMLLWSLWLAAALLNWLKWGWTCFSSEGVWKKMHSTEKSSSLISDKKQE